MLESDATRFVVTKVIQSSPGNRQYIFEPGNLGDGFVRVRHDVRQTPAYQVVRQLSLNSSASVESFSWRAWVRAS